MKAVQNEEMQLSFFGWSDPLLEASRDVWSIWLSIEAL
jgi:hypothetical protein